MTCHAADEEVGATVLHAIRHRTGVDTSCNVVLPTRHASQSKDSGLSQSPNDVSQAQDKDDTSRPALLTRRAQRSGSGFSGAREHRQADGRNGTSRPVISLTRRACPRDESGLSECPHAGHA